MPLFIAANEELWIIQRPTEWTPPPGEEDLPGSGAMFTCLPTAPTPVPVPLAHTDVAGSIAGFVSSVSVRQTFHNPYDSKIEAVYVFPLPENAAVNGFLMTIGTRTIRGVIREREQAEEIYEQARSRGHVATLLTQECPNVFTQAVANIEPGRVIDVDITYFQTLSYRDGAYEFVFPMVVGPRYNPPGSTGGVGAAGRGNAGASGQAVEAQYLRAHERSGHDITLSLEIDAGVPIEALESRSHLIQVQRPSATTARVKLSAADSIPNKDFVLRYRVAGEDVRSAMIAHHDPRTGSGYFALMLVPPADLGDLERSPLEMVFVIDSSGSMSGRPLEQAKAAVGHALRYLRPADTFQIIEFSNTAAQLGSAPLRATPENVRRGLEYVAGLTAGGGTEALAGIRTALRFDHDPERLRFVAFLTDGYIGNEADVIAELSEGLGASRVFSFGVGSSPNRHLMESMAKVGRGAVAYVGLGETGTEAMDLFLRRIAHPAMTDLRLELPDGRVDDAFPRSLPDLFVGRPVVLTGRYRGELCGPVRVSGRAGGRSVSIDAPVDLASSAVAREALPLVWARAKLADLHEASAWDRSGELAESIRRTALDYGLMSELTAFVAVDSLGRTAGATGTTVNVPVPTPEGVDHGASVQDGSVVPARSSY